MRNPKENMIMIKKEIFSLKIIKIITTLLQMVNKEDPEEPILFIKKNQRKKTTTLTMKIRKKIFL